MKTFACIWIVCALVLNAMPGHGQTLTAPVPIPVPIPETAPAPAAPVPEPPSMNELTNTVPNQMPPWDTNSPMVTTNGMDSAPETNAAKMVGPLPWFANGFTNDPEILELLKRRDDSASQLKQAQDDEAKAEADYQNEARTNSDAQWTASEKAGAAKEKAVDLEESVLFDNMLIKERIIKLLAADLNENWVNVDANALQPKSQTSLETDATNSLKSAQMPDTSGGGMNSGSSFDNTPNASNDSSTAPKSAAPIPIPIDPQK